MQIITRQEAKEKGLSRYFTGKPCKHGHMSERTVCNSGCVECKNVWKKENPDWVINWRQKNRPKIKSYNQKKCRKQYDRDYHREYYRKRRNKLTPDELEALKARQREANKRYYENNKEKELRRANEYRQRDEVVKKRKAYMDIWREENKEHRKKYARENRARYVAHCNKRRTRRLKARPSWVDRDAMDSLYEESRAITAQTGVQHHVDHYYPLTHKRICGLDVPWNLQIITAEENVAKGNKMPEEFYGLNHTMIQMPAYTKSQTG
jgi:hypothetical protein